MSQAVLVGDLKQYDCARSEAGYVSSSVLAMETVRGYLASENNRAWSSHGIGEKSV